MSYLVGIAFAQALVNSRPEYELGRLAPIRPVQNGPQLFFRVARRIVKHWVPRRSLRHPPSNLYLSLLESDEVNEVRIGTLSIIEATGFYEKLVPIP